MSQFGPPPLPPEYAPAFPQRSGPPPWSASAIGAFVLSLLGWIGITAIMGLIFAVVGLFATSGGKRRGRGLAIAAIPISVVTGAVAVLLLISFMLFARMAKVPEKMEAVFGGTDVAAQADALRALTTAEWNRAVSDEALRAWLTDLRAKHGAMTRLQLEVSKGVQNTAMGVQFVVSAKFVNGNAVIRITFDPGDPFGAKLSDIEVDGVSPRKPADAAPDAPTTP